MFLGFVVPSLHICLVCRAVALVFCIPFGNYLMSAEILFSGNVVFRHCGSSWPWVLYQWLYSIFLFDTGWGCNVPSYGAGVSCVLLQG